MNTHKHGRSLALLALAAMCGAAHADTSDHINVDASRIITRPAGRTANGLPFEEVSLSVRVSTAGLDLRTSAGLSDMEKRINTAAVSACREISWRHPLAEQSDMQCAKAAARPALAQVREVARSAARNS